jgi:hypothetical protein
VITLLAVVLIRSWVPPDKITESLDDADPRREELFDIAGKFFALSRAQG